MRLLLDTHAFLWFILDDPQLSSTARQLIEDPANEVEISPAIEPLRQVRKEAAGFRSLMHLGIGQIEVVPGIDDGVNAEAEVGEAG